jgi:Uma2 family endonuclease
VVQALPVTRNGAEAVAAQPTSVPFTIDECLAWERASQERHEYIDGYVSLMSGGTADHSALAVNITSTLHALLRGGPRRVYNADMRVQLSPTRYVYPDVSVSCDPRDRGQIEELQSPSLIVEVLSPGTEAYDRGETFGYYRACPTVQEYVLVNIRRPEIELFRRAGAFWTLTTYGPEEALDLVSLGVHLPLAGVYDGIELAGDETGA